RRSYVVFSSRRRHTRFSRDWSSDVCSSDLGRVHGSVYTDPTIFAEEMERIYHRGWVFLAHESEIPSPGDFVTRGLGLQSVIVSQIGRASSRESVINEEVRRR